MESSPATFVPTANFFKNTFCVFQACPLEMLEGLESSYTSKSGSMYYYTSQGMYRYSNHWGRLANCKWRLVEKEAIPTAKYKLGFATWDSFYPDNKYEALYYLRYEKVTKEVQYEHKNNPDYDGKALLRTADDTMKRIKLIRNCIQLTNWTKYFEGKDIAVVRERIIQQLIDTNKPIDVIKRELL